MLPKADVVRLHHMLDAALEAMDFAEGCLRDDLDGNRMLSRALVRDIEIIGEAAGKVTPVTRERCPTLPWLDIIAMRNRLIHGYFDIDLDRVWDTIVEDLPKLAEELRRILDTASDE